MAGKTKFLWVSNEPAPPNVRQALAGHELVRCRIDEPLHGDLPQSPAVLICPNGQAGDQALMDSLARELNNSFALPVYLLPGGASDLRRHLARRQPHALCLPLEISPAELSGVLAAAAGLQPVIDRLRARLPVTGEGVIPSEEAQLNEEMRLAARLQRDFLPRRLPQVGPVSFSVFYRPFSWVSGDIYDVSRLDETHLGFYVADAIGHGMPAALLTMFIKKALQTKRITGSSYEIVPPQEALAELNRDICRQHLSSCEFCTAVYCLLDTRDLTLTYSRAGHPEPLLRRADGSCERLVCPGSLLGVFPEETFDARQVTLAAGDRLLLYTDGLERALQRRSEDPPLEETLAPLLGLPRERMLLDLSEQIDQAEPRLDDDVTMVVMDVQA